MYRSDTNMYRSDTKLNRHDSILNHSESIMNIHEAGLTPSLTNLNPTVPIDTTIVPLEVMLNHQVLFPFIRYSFYHYVPNKPNKKKMKQWIEAIPYFLPEKHQDLFFTLIRNYPIETYWDSRERMEEYGYLLYSSFHESLRLSYKTKEDYRLDLYQNKTKHKQIHNFIYCAVLFILLVVLYKWIV